MKTKLPRRIVLWTSLAVIGSTAAVLGNGYRLPDQDAEATARGEAFAATADSPSAIYYNPAGIAQLPGMNVKAGVYAISLDTTFNSPSGGSYDTKSALNAAPQAFFTYGLDSLPLSFGLGFYAPYGLGVEWPQDTGFRSIALKTDLTYLSLNPVVAWRILTNLSVAIGPTFNYSQIEITQGVTPFPNNDESILKGDAWAYGFNAGILWQPIPQLSFGINYRSKTTMDYGGNTRINFVIPPPGFPSQLEMDSHASLPFPQNAVVGVSYRPTPKWNFEFDADWTDWDQVKTVNVEQAIPTTFVLNYKSSFYYEFGVTRYLKGGWQISGGYIFNENSVPDSTFSPLVPDQDRHFFSVGGGYRGKHFSFNAAYQFGYGPSRTVVGSAPSAVGQSADGQYEYFSNAFALSAGWQF